MKTQLISQVENGNRDWRNEAAVKFYHQKLKDLFVLRDRWLLTKVQVIGVIVLVNKLKDKYIVCLDDGSGAVVEAILWLHRHLDIYQNTSEKYEELDRLFRHGNTVHVFGILEVFDRKPQLKIDKMREICTLKDELEMYQHFDDVQRSYFEPILTPEQEM